MPKMISIQSGWRNIMPLWKVYHPAGAYSAQDKKEFAEKVTAMYSRIPIPKFYVVMIFEKVAAESFYVGGASHGKFVRLKLEHMARHTACRKSCRSEPSSRPESRKSPPAKAACRSMPGAAPILGRR